ncbi:unnamed protein product (macronuclear) [Paramecium tetraurelia]|uniref:Uncharacterized protein n=1 Tax=Paramecium tetraurelia TaxID=5888 RepID=A0BUJ2_PARTE|nr:uncharacterized protein GSPATT00005455001 [Paramecium tetraurelia]CAK62209.1 unnamed protein product [Paramecium tetraurelia]|eukprot:XP_001429607.1 hypothetical protein (macronuclear) [Paramecium tetraurelia strain d4-2]
MLTTIDLQINNQSLQFILNKGDNLWKKVQEFCSKNNLQKHQDQIFNLIYNEYANVEKYETIAVPPLKSTTSPVSQRQKWDKKNYIQKSNRNISPATKTLTPKMSPHKNSKTTLFVHLQNNQFEDKQLEQGCKIYQTPNVIHQKKENFYLIETSEQQQDNYNNSVINSIVKLNNLIKSIYKQIENITIEASVYPVCIQLYKRLLSTQEYRKTLKLNMINLDLLENKEIFVLEQIVQKYSLSLAIEMSKTQFVILMLGLIISDGDQMNKKGVKVKELINFNPMLTPHYQLYC